MVKCCRSSVVERILGKAEVVSSILTGSTIFPFIISMIHGGPALHGMIERRLMG